MNIYQKSKVPDHLQKYFEPAEIGLEKTPEEYVEKMVEVFREVRRTLKDDGVLWLNLGDSYAGSWGGSGHRPERTGIAGTQRKKNTKSFKRNGHPQQNKPVTVSPPGLKPKDLVGIPWRVAFALQADGWYLRQDIIWHKPNPMPESVTDRCTKAHEYVFLLSKSARYFYDYKAIKEHAKDKESHKGRRSRGPKSILTSNCRTTNPNTLDKGFEADGKTYPKVNKRSVWTIEDHTTLVEWLCKTNPEILIQFYDQVPDVFNIATHPYKDAHFATFPEKLIEPCILAGTRAGNTVIDPFFGAGTTGVVAYKHGRKFIGIELSPEYCEIAAKRIERETQQMKLFR